MKKTYLIISAVLIMAMTAFAVEFPFWEVPADATATKNPVEASKKSISDGETVFKTQCVACHGPSGDGTGGVVPAANLRSEAFLSQSDGAIHYKLITGRGTMPSFKALGDESLWNLINYLRSLSDAKAAVAKSKAKVSLDLQESNGKRYAVAKFVKINADGTESPAAEAKGGIYVKRYFGDLPVSKVAYSDANGVIRAEIPEDIHGDELGNFLMIAKLDDSSFDPATAELSMTGGKIPQNTFNQQWETYDALWRTNDHLPWWITFMYFGITGGVLIAISYVVFLIYKIKVAGK